MQVLFVGIHGGLVLTIGLQHIPFQSHRFSDPLNRINATCPGEQARGTLPGLQQFFLGQKKLGEDKLTPPDKFIT